MNDIIMISQEVAEGDPDEWPYPTITVESEIMGDLREKIFAKTGLRGRVTLIESEVSGGYSEYTQETDYGIEVFIDGVHVWSDDYNGQSAFLRWVSE